VNPRWSMLTFEYPHETADSFCSFIRSAPVRGSAAEPVAPFESQSALLRGSAAFGETSTRWFLEGNGRVGLQRANIAPTRFSCGAFFSM